jgi:hypothetical protein
MLCREERRLQNGWTYEPPTFFETNSADGPEAAARVGGVTATSTMNEEELKQFCETQRADFPRGEGKVRGRRKKTFARVFG